MIIFINLSIVHSPTDKNIHRGLQDGPSPSRNAIGSTSADERMTPTLISRPRALVVSRWIYYDLDEPEEAEAVLLEGCEHAEDLTASVKSSACSFQEIQLPLLRLIRKKVHDPFSSINL